MNTEVYLRGMGVAEGVSLLASAEERVAGVVRHSVQEEAGAIIVQW